MFFFTRWWNQWFGDEFFYLIKLQIKVIFFVLCARATILFSQCEGFGTTVIIGYAVVASLPHTCWGEVK